MTDHYDVIVVGTGAGGGTLAHTLASSGKRVLLLERGGFLPRELQNWDPKPVFVEGRYISKDTWFDRDGKPFQPQVHYFVGGATKLYGAFTQHYDTEVLDSPLLMMPLQGFIAPRDPMWLSTLHAMDRELVSDSLVYPYNPSASSDGLGGDEGTCSLCTFWYVYTLARAGRLETSPG